MPSRLRKERQGDIVLLTLCHLQRANAVDDRLLVALREAIVEAAEQGARAAVLTGAGGVFCAGYDLHALPANPDPEWLRGHGELEATLRLLREGPLPTVAALTGPAVGAGLEIALSCDLRVAHSEVVLQMPPVKLGIVYTIEGIWRLATLCGAGKARELLLLAEPVSAEAALRLGLISRLVDSSVVLETACALAQKMAAKPRPAVQGTRHLLEHLLRSGPSLSEEESARLLEIRQQSWQSPEARSARESLRARCSKPPAPPKQ
ncbi:MAG TPA: enoyl-CoA hydratase/isomerase family protein [Pseudomonadota bacterium]|nr:enoyl-CoA hydratase/isomerase family protein [Pseudomonadota bacterium]